MLKTTALVHLVYQLALGALWTNQQAIFDKHSVGSLGVVFCCCAAHTNLLPATTVREIANVLINTAHRPAKWSHLAGITWGDTNPIIKDHHLPWDGPPLTSPLKQTRKPFDQQFRKMTIYLTKHLENGSYHQLQANYMLLGCFALSREGKSAILKKGRFTCNWRCNNYSKSSISYLLVHVHPRGGALDTASWRTLPAVVAWSFRQLKSW